MVRLVHIRDVARAQVADAGAQRGGALRRPGREPRLAAGAARAAPARAGQQLAVQRVHRGRDVRRGRGRGLRRRILPARRW